MSQTVTLTECCKQQAITRDPSRPVLKGVKLLGSISKNGRRYLPEAINGGKHLYEGLPCNIDHPEKNPNASRRLADRFGIIRGVHVKNGALHGNLHYNPKHPLAEMVAWAAENQAGALGLSHNAQGSGRTEGGIFLVEKLVSVRSVDLVADAATNASLYESLQGPPMKTNRWKLPKAIRAACKVLQSGSRRLTEADVDAINGAIGDGDMNEQIAALAAAVVRSDLDAAAKLKRLKSLIDMLDEPADAEPEIPDGGADDMADLPPLDAAESFARKLVGKRLVESRGSPIRRPGMTPAQFTREVRGR